MITAVRDVIMRSLEEIYTSWEESCWYNRHGLLARHRKQAFRNTGNISTKLHDIISQQSASFRVAAVRTSNLAGSIKMALLFFLSQCSPPNFLKIYDLIKNSLRWQTCGSYAWWECMVISNSLETRAKWNPGTSCIIHI